MTRRTIQSIPPLPFFYLRFVLGLPGRRPRCWLQQRGSCCSNMASHTQGIRGNLNTLNASKTTHPSQSTRSRHSSHHHPRHVQGIQGTPQHIQGIQGTHDFVVLNRQQQNVHGVWATATFRQKSSRRVDHSNISPLQDPARRGRILRSGRRPDLLEFLLTERSFRRGFRSRRAPEPFGPFSEPSGRGPERDVSGRSARPKFRSTRPDARATTWTRRGTRRRTTTRRGHRFGERSQK